MTLNPLTDYSKFKAECEVIRRGVEHQGVWGLSNLETKPLSPVPGGGLPFPCPSPLPWLALLLAHQIWNHSSSWGSILDSSWGHLRPSLGSCWPMWPAWCLRCGHVGPCWVQAVSGQPQHGFSWFKFGQIGPKNTSKAPPRNNSVILKSRDGTVVTAKTN